MRKRELLTQRVGGDWGPSIPVRPSVRPSIQLVLVKTAGKPRGFNLIQTTFVTFRRTGVDIYGCEDAASPLIRFTSSSSKLPWPRRRGGC